MTTLCDLYILLNHLLVERDELEQKIQQTEQDIANIENRNYNDTKGD